MSHHEFDEIKTDLLEIKEQLKILQTEVAVDKIIAAARTEKKIKEKVRREQIRGIIVNNRHLMQLAE